MQTAGIQFWIRSLFINYMLHKSDLACDDANEILKLFSYDEVIPEQLEAAKQQMTLYQQQISEEKEFIKHATKKVDEIELYYSRDL